MLSVVFHHYLLYDFNMSNCDIYGRNDKSMNTKRWIAIAVVVVLLVVSIGFKVVTTFASILLSDEFNFSRGYMEESVIVEGNSQEKIAVLNLQGTIANVAPAPLAGQVYNHPFFLDTIDTAAEDPTVKAILLNVDSPGGGVTETAEIHRKIVELQAEYDKPIYVTMGNMAASGGYYVAAPADKIFAEASTLTGSIGVIMQSMNFAGLAEKYGIEFNTIKSGKHKDIMSPTREMTKDEEDIMQSMIDEMYDEFVDVIVEGRDLSEKHVREVGDGRIYTGKQAVEVDLVDEVGSFEDALTQLQVDNNLENARVIQYDAEFSYWMQFLMSAQNIVSGESDELNTIIELIYESDQPRAMYLY